MGKRYFELVDGTSSKFWEIWIDGNEVRTRYGRIGSQGQTTVKDQGSGAAASKLHDSLVAEKTRKGYLEKAPGTAPAVVAAPATASVAGELEAVFKQIGRNAREAGVTLAPGATEKAIAAAEKALGRALPEEVRAFYRRHDGSEDEAAVEGRELLSLERMVSEWQCWKGLLDDGTFEANDHGEPGKGVQRKWWIPDWVPVTYDGSGNHHVIDLAPAAGGTRGQIISFWHDEASRTVVGNSFLGWLAETSWGAEEDEEEDDEEDDEDDDGFRRFEMDEKFWTIRLDEGGTSFTVRFGKKGTEGQEKTKDFGDKAAANKEYDKLIAEKTKKGYREG